MTRPKAKPKPAPVNVTSPDEDEEDHNEPTVAATAGSPPVPDAAPASPHKARGRTLEGVGAVPAAAAWWRAYRVSPNGSREAIEVDSGRGYAVREWPVSMLSLDSLLEVAQPGQRIEVRYFDRAHKPAGASAPILITDQEEEEDEEEVAHQAIPVPGPLDALAGVERLQALVRDRAEAETRMVDAKTNAQIEGMVRLAQVFQGGGNNRSDERLVALLERMDHRLTAIEAREEARQLYGTQLAQVQPQPQDMTQDMTQAALASVAQAAVPTSGGPFQVGQGSLSDQLPIVAANLAVQVAELVLPTIIEKLTASKPAPALAPVEVPQAQQHVNGAGWDGPPTVDVPLPAPGEGEVPS